MYVELCLSAVSCVIGCVFVCWFECGYQVCAVSYDCRCVCEGYDPLYLSTYIASWWPRGVVGVRVVMVTGSSIDEGFWEWVYTGVHTGY